MEFTQYTCPVCENRFENGDDVVVCPECGAPHHRECWEELGHCFYEERHGEGFSFEDAADGDGENGDSAAETVVCQRCGAENEKTNFYCGTCGYPMHAEDRTEQTNAQQTQNQPPYSQGMPFGFGATGNPMYDPMAGMNSEEEIADGVKVGEAAKFIGKNTPYYLQVFRRIRQFGSGKFNFSAFLFTGAYFLYRKMYVPGVLLMLARIGIVVGSTALALSNSWMGTMQYSELMNGIYNNTLGAEKMTVLMISAGLSLLRFGLMAFSGLSANKLYHSHCMNHIRQIKQDCSDGNLNKELEAKGGVNLPMAISFFASYLVIYEICNMYLFFQL